LTPPAQRAVRWRPHIPGHVTAGRGGLGRALVAACASPSLSPS
jgi:hypothetical protein